MAYLSELHPEVYLVSPRPGGLANIVPPKVSTEPRPSIISGKTSKGDKSSIMGKISLKSYKSSVGAMSRRGSARSSAMTNIDANFLSSTPENNSREYRINQVLHSSGWMPPDYDDDVDISMPSDPLNNVMVILSLTISTILLMSVDNKDISKDHLRWTLSYLECVRDEHGNFPPNVRGIMNHIKLIDDTLESFNETEIIDGGVLNAATDGVISEKPEPAVETANLINF